jgi:chromate transporter
MASERALEPASGSDQRTEFDALNETSLGELARVFAWLGSVAFGGPAAHIAMMREQLVARRKWLSDERFLDLLGASNLIPGPNSTELAIHIGFERKRFAGLFVAGVSFIAPAMFITGALGFAYVHFQHRPALGWLFYGVKPVIVAVVAQAIYGLVPAAARSLRLRVFFAIALVLTAVGVNELFVLFGVGLSNAFAGAEKRAASGARISVSDVLVPATAVAAPALTHVVTLPALFGVFFKIGSVLFGSGYVLLSFLRADLVERLGWLREPELLDAIAVGQITPGPVFTTATFIGYLLRGPAGALTATAGIFLPAFVFVALSGPLVPRLRSSPRAGAFLDGVNVASLALMMVVTMQLAQSALVDIPSVLLMLLSAYLLLVHKVNSTWLLLGGALLGTVRHLT